jgi:hypothetical protein
MSKIVIKKGTMTLEVDRSELVQVEETPDGISFDFKHGIQLLFSDQYMESARKNVIKNTSNSYPGKKLVFDLDNKRHPVMVHADE